MGLPGDGRMLTAPRSRPVTGRRADALAALGYLIAAVLLFRPLWTNLGHGYLTNSGQDQNMWEWFFSVTAHAVAGLENPLSSGLQNHPAGVNLMANTAMLGLGVPLTPVTLVFGPAVTWALVLTGGLAGSAFAWYHLLSRRLVGSRAAAALGGACCAFAPPIISHANAHPNFVALFVLPFIIGRFLDLVRGARPVRDGVLLGLLVTYQVFLGEEPLVITALGLLVFAVTYALSRPSEVPAMLRPLATGLGVAAVTSLALLIFPLWWQFFGPQSYHSLEHGPQGNDAAAFTAFASDSLAGDAESARGLAMNRTEENAFFGWPLVLLLTAISAWLWRRAVARALAVTLFVLALISMGSPLTVAGHETGIPGPWRLLAGLPLLESVLESRFALGCAPVAGLLLALATDRVLTAATVAEWRGAARVIWSAVLLFALVPIVPVELAARERAPAPAFFALDLWRDHVRPGRSVLMVPPPDTGDAEPLHWQVLAGLGFPLAEGYFVGPGGKDRAGQYGAVRRPTSNLLERVANTGRVPPANPIDQLIAENDLRFWQADVVVLAPQQRRATELKQTVEQLLGGPGTVVGGVWLWDVRR
ncbi:glycosyl transferase [Amycolatopsis nigrescens]|uniref:glycosyl transferase n=1 Tax=Amycolatopsis nigrescens TaxID=381445 RepID=UPI0003A7E2C9|nr:glycosyl transferase [Amycolatopsis nigrescens]